MAQPEDRETEAGHNGEKGDNYEQRDDDEESEGDGPKHYKPKGDESEHDHLKGDKH